METRQDASNNYGLKPPSPAAAPATTAPPDDFQIKGAASAAALKSSQKNHIPPPEPETCAICLEAIHERAVAAPCNHLSFDFICLVQWLQQHATCPLCKAEVKGVEYDWRSPEDYKTYTVVEPRPGAKAPESHDTHRRGTTTTAAGTARRRRNHTPGSPTSSTATVDPSLPRRRLVYDNRTPCLHVGANRHSLYHPPITPTTFASSPTLQTRARIFLRRELCVFPFLDRRPARGANREFLVEYVVAVLKAHDPKSADGRAGELLGGFLGWEDAWLVLHELEAWLRSPFERLEGWDEEVQYLDPRCGCGRGGGSAKQGRREEGEVR